MQHFSFKRFFILVLILAAGAGLGLGIQHYFLSPSQAQREVLSQSDEASRVVVGTASFSCEGESTFSNNLYPSLMLSFGAVAPEFVTCITVRIKHVDVGEKYQIKVDSHLFETSLVKTLVADKEELTLTPSLPWNFSKLRGVTQVRPETVLVSVISSSGKRAQSSFIVTVHPVNEVVSKVYDSDNGQWQDTSICFASYVNENHPLINGIIQDVTSKGKIARFTGYEFGPKSVQEQMQAIWTTLSERGLNYVDLATTSSQVSGISSQYVRFIDQSLKDQGANCVDASILFASIFRRIGLRPVLVFVPGHCFVCVYDTEQGGQLIALETTLLSSASYADAVSAGEKEMNIASQTLGQPGYSSIDISLARDSGVQPIEFEPSL